MPIRSAINTYLIPAIIIAVLGIIIFAQASVASRNAQEGAQKLADAVSRANQYQGSLEEEKAAHGRLIALRESEAQLLIQRESELRANQQNHLRTQQALQLALEINRDWASGRIPPGVIDGLSKKP